MGRLEGKIALITGSNSGVGEQTAKEFVKEGAKVIICARREEALNEAKKALEEMGGEVLSVRADIANKADVENLFHAIEENTEGSTSLSTMQVCSITISIRFQITRTKTSTGSSLSIRKERCKSQEEHLSSWKKKAREPSSMSPLLPANTVVAELSMSQLRVL